MRKVIFAAFGAVLTLAVTEVSARAETATRIDARGHKVKVVLTGRYSDCVAGGVKMGYSQQAAIRYCNARPGLRH